MKLLFISLLFLAAGCKKNADAVSKFANNHTTINVTSASGAVTTYNFNGDLAPMGHSYWTGEFYGEGRFNYDHTQIYFGPAADPSKVSCKFYLTSGSSPYDTPYNNPGTFNLTKTADNHAEGSFSAKCGLGADTLMIQGNFSGYYTP